ncbi:hypothetical protein BGX26_008623 [Mortierella sp. AD094]|nr:hypothetical protein BGX26_008623 [Mortierella sp. AD094]
MTANNFGLHLTSITDCTTAVARSRWYGRPREVHVWGFKLKCRVSSEVHDYMSHESSPKRLQSPYKIKIPDEVFHIVTGATVSCGGADNAVKIARSLGMAANAAITTIQEIKTIYDLDRPAYFALPAKDSQAPGIVDVETTRRVHKVKRIARYHFQGPELLMQAVTHGGASINSTTQRLELLGRVSDMEFEPFHYLYSYSAFDAW